MGKGKNGPSLTTRSKSGKQREIEKGGTTTSKTTSKRKITSLEKRRKALPPKVATPAWIKYYEEQSKDAESPYGKGFQKPIDYYERLMESYVSSEDQFFDTLKENPEACSVIFADNSGNMRIIHQLTAKNHGKPIIVDLDGLGSMSEVKAVHEELFVNKVVMDDDDERKVVPDLDDFVSNMGDIAYIMLRLAFGGAANPPAWCAFSEMITDLANEIALDKDWDPQELRSMDAPAPAEPKTLDETIPLARAEPMSVVIPTTSTSRADCFIDDIDPGGSTVELTWSFSPPATCTTKWHTSIHIPQPLYASSLITSQFAHFQNLRTRYCHPDNGWAYPRLLSCFLEMHRLEPVNMIVAACDYLVDST